ncbi:MAG: phosphate signaling complex protein PhoU [SAR324 cluster bacterium]|nr:phosphate signaling complex protein PhoU [SAR324 cluster bacterium]
MRLHIHKAIEKLNARILEMGAMVEENLKAAVVAYESFDVDEARILIKKDKHINEMEIDIEEDCLKILALYQPVAIDLRRIVSVLKINNELERINDFVVNLAERVIALSHFGQVKIEFDLAGMAEKAQVMLAKSLDSFIRLDTKTARQVLILDDEVDDMHKEVYKIVETQIQKNPEKIEILIQFPSISRYLERIADLACNIAEDVIYLADGDIVRHRSFDEI